MIQASRRSSINCARMRIDIDCWLTNIRLPTRWSARRPFTTWAATRSCSASTRSWSERGRAGAMRRGTVVERGDDPRSRQVVFNIPTLTQFAEPAFLADHCFANGGTENVDGHPVIRIDFAAASKIRQPDVSGSMYLDSFQLSDSTLEAAADAHSGRDAGNCRRRGRDGVRRSGYRRSRLRRTSAQCMCCTPIDLAPFCPTRPTRRNDGCA